MKFDDDKYVTEELPEDRFGLRDLPPPQPAGWWLVCAGIAFGLFLAVVFGIID